MINNYYAEARFYYLDMYDKLNLRARAAPTLKFDGLYGKISEDLILRWAFYICQKGNGSPGLDRISYQDIKAAGIDKYLKEIKDELIREAYKPSPLRGCSIPKANGKTRKLCIPTIRDRIVQRACVLMINAIMEAYFHKCSYAYRIGITQIAAIQEVIENLKEGRTTVLDADIYKCFDNINRQIVSQNLKSRIIDNTLLNLIESFMQAPIIEDNTPVYRSQGVNQGGVISPLLSNVAMHTFDSLFYEGDFASKYEAAMVRYSDDFIIMVPRFIDAKLLTKVKEVLSTINLELNQEKTKVINLRDGQPLHFLGYEISIIQVKPLKLKVAPQKKNIEKLKWSIATIVQNVDTGNRKSVEEMIININQNLNSFEGYYTLCNWGDVHASINYHVKHLISKTFRNSKEVIKRIDRIG